jgi:hypothetical protein
MKPSRRALISLTAGTALAGPGQAEVAQSPRPGEASVTAFGARGDGQTDDTAAFSAAAAGAAPVVVPRGLYALKGSVTFTAPVSLEPGALLRAGSAAVLDFRAGVNAGLYTIFELSGDARVVFGSSAVSHGYPEWWGAVPGTPTLDCAPAINACIAACPITQLQAGAYYTRSEIVIAVHGRTLQGVQATQQAYAAAGLGTLSSTCTQIVLTNGSMTGMLVGHDVASEPRFLLEFVKLSDFAIYRATAATPLGVPGAQAIQNPASGILPCPTAIRFKWCVNLQVQRVLVAEHAIGFYIYGCVESYWTNCSSLRSTLGAVRSNDRFSGFYLDYSAHLSANGGNASIYINRCRSFCNNQPMTYQAGLTTHEGFVDLFIDRFETGLTQFGLDLQGDGAGSMSPRSEDCQIAGVVLDSAAIAAIRIQSAGANTDVHINGGYLACGPAAACLLLGGSGGGQGIGGSVSVTGVQMIGAGSGVVAQDVATVNLLANTYADVPTPIKLTNAQASEIRDFVHRPTSGNPQPAVTLVGCSNCEVAVGAKGAEGAMSCGVSVDGSSSNCEINVTRVQAALVGGARNKILYKGAPWGGGRTFGEGNIATGVPT